MRSRYTNSALAIGLFTLLSLSATILPAACPATPAGLMTQFTSKDHHWYQYALSRYAEKGKPEMQQMLDQLPTFRPFLDHALEEYDLPLWLKYVTLAESRLELAAESPAGAAGLWQLMPATARSLGLRVDKQVDERLDPVHGSRAAAALLHDLYQQFDNWLLALAAYNCGPGNVRKAQRRARSKDYADIRRFLPSQTRRYIPRVLAVATIAQQPECFDLRAPTKSSPFFVQPLAGATSFRQIAAEFGLPLEELRQLNPAYRQNHIPYAAEGRWLLLPKEAAPCYQAPTVFGIGTWLLYQVQAGDSLQDLSRNSGLPVAALEAWNQLPHQRLLPGQALFLPIIRSYDPAA